MTHTPSISQNWQGRYGPGAKTGRSQSTRASPWGRECAGRLAISPSFRFEARIFQTLKDTLGPFSIDLFASRTNHQLPAYCSWKPDPAAVAIDGLSINWKDYIFPHPSLLEETGVREGPSSPSSSSLAKPGMVPSVAEVPNGSAHPVSPDSGLYYRPTRIQSFNGAGQPPATSRMACIRRSCATEGLSERVLGTIKSSWRPSTEAAYSSAWKLWAGWCVGRNIDPPFLPL